MGARKKLLISFLIDDDLYAGLMEIHARTGISKSEQIREGVRLWLDSRRWPEKHDGQSVPGSPAGEGRRRTKPPG